MASCPKCRVPVGDAQRRCRACGCDLEQARSGGGLLGRFRRWLAGAGRFRIAVPRVHLSVRVRRESQGEGGGDAEDLESLPPEDRAAVAGAPHDRSAADSVVKTISMGPVKVTTHTTTRTYRSLNEMPPELRQRAEAALKGGTAPSSAAITVTINGEKRTYSRIDDVPEPYRQAIAEARQKTG